MADWPWQGAALPLGVSAVGAICWLAFMRPAAYLRFQRAAMFLLFTSCMAYLIYVLGFFQGSASAIQQLESGVPKEIINKSFSAWPLFGALAIFIFLIAIEALSQYVDLDGEKAKSDKS